MQRLYNCLKSVRARLQETHTQDVKAHCAISTLLGGEEIPRELVDGCREKTHMRKLKN